MPGDLPTFAQQLVPAFIAAAICLLVVGGGVVIMVRLQGMPEAARRGFRWSGIALALCGAAGTGIAWAHVDRLGLWLLAVPAAVLVDAALFGWMARRR